MGESCVQLHSILGCTIMGKSHWGVMETTHPYSTGLQKEWDAGVKTLTWPACGQCSTVAHVASTRSVLHSAAPPSISLPERSLSRQEEGPQVMKNACSPGSKQVKQEDDHEFKTRLRFRARSCLRKPKDKRWERGGRVGRGKWKRRRKGKGKRKEKKGKGMVVESSY